MLASLARYRARRIGAFPFAYRGLKNITSLTLRFHVFQRQHLSPGSMVISDGLACFSAALKAGCHRHSIVTGGGPQSVTKEEFTRVNTMIGNVKKAINGTYHAISPKHLPRYLAEFCYRHNRRFHLEGMLPRLAYVAVRTPPMPGRLLKLAEAYG